MTIQFLFLEISPKWVHNQQSYQHIACMAVPAQTTPVILQTLRSQEENNRWAAELNGQLGTASVLNNSNELNTKHSVKSDWDSTRGRQRSY